MVNFYLLICRWLIAFSDGSIHWKSNLNSIDVVFVDAVNEGSTARSGDIETTSYALLTYVLRGDTQKCLPIVHWLTSQRNSLGGFRSTQVHHLHRTRLFSRQKTKSDFPGHCCWPSGMEFNFCLKLQILFSQFKINAFMKNIFNIPINTICWYNIY